ncbi:MAG TPA: toll/interleukin-1 receptor domain-containing protein [Allosphingosinicella sp.]|jgi:hypothetical protein
MGAGHIFVSYTSADRPFADELVRALEAARLQIWYAPRDVRPGVDYSEQIQKAIETAVAFVVIVSDASNKSRFVRAETEMAFSRGQAIFPVRTSPVTPAPGLALFLQLRHWTDVFGHAQKRAVARLTDELVAASRNRGRGTVGGTRTLFHPSLSRIAQGLSSKPLRGRRAHIVLTAVGLLCLVLAVVIALRGETRAQAEQNEAVQVNGLIAGAPPGVAPDTGGLDYGPVPGVGEGGINWPYDPYPPPEIEPDPGDSQAADNTNVSTPSTDAVNSVGNDAGADVNGM